MTPENGKVYLAKAEELLAQFDPGSVGAIITDYPYGTADRGKVIKRGSEHVSFDLAWDREAPLDWVRHAAAALTPGGPFLCFCDRMDPNALIAECRAAGLQLVNTFYWVKTNPPPHPRSNFTSGVEVAVYCYKPGGDRYWAGGGSTPNYLEAPICGGAERTAHPTQKPLAVMRHLVRLLVAPGAFVFDPFLGSGTTGEACIGEGRPWAGCDNDPEMVAIAKARLSRVVPPLIGLWEPAAPAECWVNGGLDL